MKKMRLLAGLLLFAPIACQAKDPTAFSAAGMRLAPLSITTAAGQTHKFQVEVAATDAQQERGLMFRPTLAPDAGMIFPMKPARFATFWMKNTLIPLDMVFIRADGRIARIAAQTVPYSLMPVDSGEPVAAVLELAGGRAAELGIAPGDRVRWQP
ncbi:MAG: DUF192 domain-containing protein [Chakrabartia sp.]